MTARVLEFVQKLKGKTRLTVEDATAPHYARKGELLWIQAAQSQLCQHPHFEWLMGQFGLFMDKHGVRRCGDCLSKAAIVKHPLLLPQQHNLATLVVRRAHLSTMV